MDTWFLHRPLLRADVRAMTPALHAALVLRFRVVISAASVVFVISGLLWDQVLLAIALVLYGMALGVLVPLALVRDAKHTHVSSS